MINVSSEFKEIMMQRQDFKENAEVTFSDGTVLNLEEKDFSISNNGVVDAADTNAVPIGAALCRSIQIELLNDDDHLESYDFYGAKVRLYLTFTLSDTVEKIEFGTFTVTSPECYGTAVTVDAFDDMYKANMPYSTDLSFPATAGAVLRDACSRCNILIGTAAFLHDDFQIQTKPSGDYTFRQIIGYIAMIACGNARINRNGKLEILTYDLDFTRGYHNLTEWKSLTVDTSDITITGIQTTRKVKKTEGEKETEVEETVRAGSEGYMLTVSNPLASGNEEALVSWINERIAGIPFRKFTGDYITYPLVEFMDLAKITDWRGNTYNTFVTDINFVFFGITTLKNSAESGLRNASTYGNSDAQTKIYLQDLINQERSERQEAIKKLGDSLNAGGGLYSTYEKQPDGSTITYLHDKPTLGESKTVIKITSEAIGVSQDGGKTYLYGFVLDGDMIARILYAHGIDADYINTGAITVRDAETKEIIFSVDIDTGKVIVSGDIIQIGGKKLGTILDDLDERIKKSGNIVMQLDNEYQGIPADYNGNISQFPSVKTHVTVFYGHDDVSASCTYSVQKSSSITGSWDNARREYIVTELSADTGWVDITANYMNLFTVTKRFNVAKNKGGTPGISGTSVTITSKSITYQASSNGTTPPTGEWNPSVPSIEKGQYLWTRTIVNYSDGSSTTSYSVGYQGSNGANGLNAATIYLYQRKTSVPEKPSAAITYTFATGAVSGLTNGWSKTIPSGTDPLYVILATAASMDASDTIAATEWSIPVIMAENGKPGADGIPGRTYFIEASSNVLKRSKDNTISPNFIEFKAYYRDGNSAARIPYAGRFIIEETVDGNTWKTIYTSTANEDTVKHYLYSLLSTQTGQIVAAENGSIIGVPRDVTSVRCKLYASGGTTNLMDMQSVAVVVDVDALTFEEIFNLLTKNGEIKGIYQDGNQLYISFTYAKGGALTLGGNGNGNGTLKILDASGAQVGYIDNTGVHFNQGEFSGTLKAATGTFKGKLEAATGSFSGNLNAGVGGVIGGWKIGGNYIQSTDGSLTLYSDGRVKFNGSVLRSNGHGMSIKYGLELYTNSGGDFSDGTDGFRIHGLGSLSGRTLVLNSDKYVGLSASSSRRYKDHIRNMSEEEALALMDVPVVWFRYKDGYLNKDDDLNGKEIPGFYAENIADSMRELAIFNSDGSVEDWNYRTVIPVMEKQIQILNKKMEDIMKKYNDNTKM